MKSFSLSELQAKTSNSKSRGMNQEHEISTLIKNFALLIFFSLFQMSRFILYFKNIVTSDFIFFCGIKNF